MNKQNIHCEAFKKCGGCDYIDVCYDEQLEKKQQREEKLFASFCKVEPIIGMGNPLFYRNKVHHVFSFDKQKGVFSGSYQENSHRVVEVKKCFLEDEECQDIIKSIEALCKSFKIKAFNEDTGYGLLRHVLIRKGFSTGEIMVVLVLADSILPGKNNFVKALRDKHPNITTIVLNVNDKKTGMVLGSFSKTIYGPGFIKDKLCGCTFKISPSSFYQVNPVQTEILYKKAIEFADLSGKENVIDAYCGIGTIGICAASSAKEVIGVELNKDAVKDAVSNAKENNINNIRFVNGDAGDFMVKYSESGKSADVVFMDPPRSGSTEKFIDCVIKMKPSRVVYISCDPDTLKRDLLYFIKKGMKVEKIQPVDMFPFTSHVETVVLMSKVK